MVAPDLPGHGESAGLRGFIHSAEALCDDAVAFIRAARASHPGLPLFLMGSSMGGAICVQASLDADVGKDVCGLVLLAPMLGPPAVSMPARIALGLLSATPLCRLALIPSSATDNSKQYADPDIIAEIADDELAYKGALRLGSASAAIDLGSLCEATVTQVRCPFFCLTAEREAVLGPASKLAAETMAREAATPAAQRLHRRYDALHGILCEPEPMRSQVVNDIVNWLDARAAEAARGSDAA